MKILFVTSCYPSAQRPQYCVFLEQQAKALVNLSNSVDILYLNENALGFKEYSFNGLKVYDCPIEKSKKIEAIIPISLSKRCCTVIEKIITDNYDAVSLHLLNSKSKKAVIRICNSNGIPSIMHFHGLNVWREEKEKYKLVYDLQRMRNKKLYKKITAAVGVSDKVCAEFCRVIGNVPCYTVYNGVDIQKFNYKNRTALSYPLRILCVANLIDLKGQDLLINAVNETIKSGIDCTLTLVGDGPNLARLQCLCESLGISDKVSFTGALSYEMVAEVMSENDIFIMPSYYEALGCVYLEAMASGMITVGVKGQGIDEIIKDGKNGFLLAPESIESITMTVRKIYGMTADEISGVSDLARITAGNYSWDDSAKALSEVYKKTVFSYSEEKG